MIRSLLDSSNSYPVLSDVDEKSLCSEYYNTKSTAILDRLVRHNLRLVHKIARDYQSDEDVVAEGCMGLMIGIQKFDPKRGLKLSTYVTWWIRAYILNHLVKNKALVKMGTTQAQRKLFFNLRKEQASLASQGLDVTPELIAEKLQVEESEVREMDLRLSEEVRLDAPLSENEGSQLDLLTADGISPDEALETAQLAAEFESFAQTLKHNEQMVFKLRMVEGEDFGWTLQAVGDVLGVTRERVRQIEAKLTPKFKKFCKTRDLY